MVEEYLIRFAAGGIAVSIFAAIGDVLRPKSFAGLFGAAPSIAIATLLMAMSKQGGGYAAIEGRSMIIGAIALGVCSLVSCQLMKRLRLSGITSTLLASLAWFGCAFGLYWLLLAGS